MKLDKIDGLDLPIIKEDVMPPPILSMDEYLKFVEFCWTNTNTRAGDDAWRKISAVDVKFTLE